MDTTLPQKISFILDRNLAKANCTGNHVCTYCDKVVLGIGHIHFTLLRRASTYFDTSLQNYSSNLQ